jgi:hypothetical protein
MTLSREVILKLEWSVMSYVYINLPCCPICRGIKPNCKGAAKGYDSIGVGHRNGCILAKALLE